MKKYIFYSFLFLSIVACDKVDDPFEGTSGPSFNIGGVEFISDPSLNLTDSADYADFILGHTWDSDVSPSNENQRFIVLEEFTGHTCTFCPNGTREIVRLDDKYGDQLIPLGIHTGSFATPATNGDKFTTDFRTEPHGGTYATTFGSTSFPSGIVSRTSASTTGLNDWEQAIISIKDDAPLASLELTSYSSTETNTLRANIKFTWKQTLPEDYNLQVFLVEDNIVDWQLDNGVQNETYNHRHVLRMVVNDTFGKALDAAEDGEGQEIQYIFPIDANWKVDDLEVIAYIFKDGTNGDYEIIQANASHVK